MTLFSHILVAVDFSDFSQEAVRMASGLACAFGGDVMVLYVSDTPKGVDPSLMARDARAIRTLLELQKDNAKAALEKIDRWVGHYEWGEARVQIDVEQGSAHGRIIARAREMDADLIVMGAHGRSGFAQRFIGTTTERVVRKAPCAVLAVTLPED